MGENKFKNRKKESNQLLEDTDELEIGLYNATETVSRIKRLSEQDKFDSNDLECLLLVMELFDGPIIIADGIKKHGLSKQDFAHSLTKLANNQYKLLTFRIKHKSSNSIKEGEMNAAD